MTDEIEEIENLKKFESLIGQIEKDAKSKDDEEEDAKKEIEKWAKSIKGRKVKKYPFCKKKQQANNPCKNLIQTRGWVAKLLVNILLLKSFQVFSQNDEDGAIEEVFRKIGTTDKVKIESLAYSRYGKRGG